MDIKQTGKIMDVLRLSYPQFYAKQSDIDREKALRLWQKMFEDDDYRAVALAVKAIVVSDTSPFPPSIGGVKAKMRQLFSEPELTEAEAWRLVSKACENGYYGAKKEFDKLPPTIQQVVGSPNQLREWSMMDVDTVGSVVASNFQRSYRAVIARQRETMALPADVKTAIAEVAGKLALHD